MAWTKMVSMERSDEEMFDASMPVAMPEQPKFPPGLRICLTQDELAKLGLKPDCQVGDVIDMRIFACVTSVSCNQTDTGEQSRVELQIEDIALENESTEATPDPQGD